MPDKKITRAVLLILIALIVFTDFPVNAAAYGIVSAIVYACFIINTFSASNKIITFEKPWLSYLGNISYGIYMFHPYLSYVLRFAMIKNQGIKNVVISVPLIYYIVMLGITILVAHLSYKYFEMRFLQLKRRLGDL